jgi:hypothetical protein
MQERNGEQAVGRRRLLRRAGTVAAGVAGATAVGAVVATPSQAAPGDPVIQGGPNDAGGKSTGLTVNNPTDATLELGNTAILNGEVGPALRLVPSGDVLAAGVPAGGISIDASGNIWVSAPDGGGGTWPEYVHTQRTSNTTVPIVPKRMIDTRFSWGRQFIMNPGGNLAANGQLLSNKTIEIDLSQLVFFAEAVFLNATVTGQIANGFVQVWPTGYPRPNSSNVNYVKGQDLSNFAATQVGSNANSLDVISIFTTQTTHVIIDIAAFVVGWGSVNPAFSSMGASSASATAAAASPAELRERKARSDGPKKW